MTYQEIPIGMLQNDELFNALMGLWKARTSVPAESQGAELYNLGFDAGLDAVAQVAGLSELFNEAKARHQRRLAARLEAQPSVRVEAPSMLRLGD